MNELQFILSDFIKGKSVYPPLRRILNFTLNTSISSFIYEFFYGPYQWLDFNDYKGILDFFIKGNFFIPFSIFIITYGVIEVSSVFSFKLFHHFKTLKHSRQIIASQLSKSDIDHKLSEFEEKTKPVSQIALTKDKLIELYQVLKKEITPQALSEMQKGLDDLKRSIEAQFALTLRLLIAISIYFLSLPHFGLLLYIIVMCLLVGLLYLLNVSYSLLDILPALTRKFNLVAEKYLEDINATEAVKILEE
jgi:hypothetical protein